MSFHVPEAHRIIAGEMASDISYGNNGAFIVKINAMEALFCIVSDGMGWEHVSVSLINKMNKQRTPTWDQMCIAKNLFWDEEDMAIQFHPKLSEYVNNHPNVLHLWRPIGIDLPFPLSIMVGFK